MRGTIKYHKELQRTYVIAKECIPEIVESYCGQMVLRGNIQGLAVCETRLTDGEQEIWYDISFLQPLEQVYAVKEIGRRELKELLLQVIQVLREAENYLLDARQLCFDPGFLYWDMETASVVFLFDFTELCDEKGPADTIGGLASFLLERTCHEEEAAVDLVYHFYECTQKGSFSLAETEQYLTTETGEKAASGDFREQKEDIKPDITESAGENAANDIVTERWDIPAQAGENADPFSWNSKAGRWVEGGLVCTVMGILAGTAFFAVQKGYILEEGERLLAMGAAAVLFLAGMAAALHGWSMEKRKEVKTDREIQKENGVPFLPAEMETETVMWQKEIEAEKNLQAAGYDAETDGKTVYVGMTARVRKYMLTEIKKGAQREYPVTSYPFVIGKDKERVNLQVKEHSVSRIHARLLEEDGDIYLEDLHSTNGTCLNDIPLEPHVKMKLKRGDSILFGQAEFSFH